MVRQERVLMLLVPALVLGFALPAGGSPGTRPPTDVNVINDEFHSVPVELQGTAQVTGDVNVANTPNVNVANTPTVNLADNQVLAQPGVPTMPFLRSVSLDLDECTNCDDETLLVVPADRRAVVELVTAELRLEDGVQPVVELVVFGSEDGSGGSIHVELLPQVQLAGGHVRYIASDPIRLYLGPNEALVASMFVAPTPPAGSVVLGRVSISGYMVAAT